MAKYDPLFRHLCKADDGPLSMTFDEIDLLVGALPQAALSHRSWWANDVDGRHVQAAAWLNAGREVATVDLSRRSVRFSAAGWRRGA